ncbi:MAG: hypothetical protein IPP12_19230 [Nitrospira sp.]|nr:hypothetical protein [Nitrospira sp.]
MAQSSLPGIQPPALDGWPSPVVTWQHSGQSGHFQVQIDLIRGIGRAGAVPNLALRYESGDANGPCGLGWSLSIPSITRGNGRHLPRYRDAGPETDTFASEYGELLPALTNNGGRWNPERTFIDGFDVLRFRPRVEEAFVRIERRTDPTTGTAHWLTRSRDNVTRIYGRTSQARLEDPADSRRVFRWLLEEEWDSRGNHIRYEYKREDLAGVPLDSLSERHRLQASQPEAQLHLKRVLWGNDRPFHPGGWLFQLVFDYGEHDRENPIPEDNGSWSVRPDPFSIYRAGFELRTRRLCRRVLLFQQLETVSRLLRAHELEYVASAEVSLLSNVTLRSYRWQPSGTVEHAVLPRTTFDYGAALPPGPIRDMTALDGQTAVGAVAAEQSWLDLEGNSLPGILTRQPGGSVCYRPNLGDGLLGAPMVLPTRPSMTDKAVPIGQSFGQPFGDSRSALVDLQTGPGYQERLRTGVWQAFTPFPVSPTVRRTASVARSLDLDGDGRADLMLADGRGPVWHPFQGRDGWAPARAAVASPSSWTALADSTGTVLLADMSGDGLADLVQVRSGSVCYWPNLGYGQFGEPVHMAAAPFLDGPDLFDPARVRLFDVDGTGGADLVYLGRDSVTWYPNQSGNQFGAAQRVTGVPTVTDLDTIDVVDLLGTGTGCLVWSSILPGHAARPVRFVELVGGQRPHQLTVVQNGQGLAARVTYTPSTHLMLNDRAAGHPWVSTFPFSEWVVTELQEEDSISGVRRSSQWSYRHGYYEDAVRETRGFAYVARRDQDHIPDDPEGIVFSSPLPSLETRTWYHTGGYEGRATFEARIAEEFFHGDPVNPARPGLAVDDSIGLVQRELVRALQGKPLRQEVHAVGGRCPFSVTDYGYLLRAVQPSAVELPPAVAAFETEVVEHVYEQVPDDPRVAHRMALTIDGFGNTVRSATLGYPRRTPVEPEQGHALATLEEQEVANIANEHNWYRVGVPFSSRTIELQSLPSLSSGALYTIDQLASVPPDSRRLIRATQLYYWNEELSGPALLGAVGPLALVHHQELAAATPDLLTLLLGSEAPAPDELQAAGYGLREGRWWARGSVIHVERDSFYQPVREETALGATFNIRYDSHSLFVTEVLDPVGNRQRAEYDSQAFAPTIITDPNGATITFGYDALALPIVMAAAGLHGEGDTMAAPTVQISRDLLRWEREALPITMRTASRVRHADPDSPWERTIIHFDGRGRPLQQKRLAERDWVMESSTVASAGGEALRVYLPIFSPHDRFTPEGALADVPVVRSNLDALGRVVETRRADGALARTIPSAWRTEQWDPNDAVRDSDWLRTRRRPDASEREWAEADAAEAHAATPTVTHLDVLGRAFLEVRDGGPAGLASTRTALSVAGELLAVTDPRGIITEQRHYDLLGRAWRTQSTASGETKVFLDVENQPVRAWGANGQQHRWHRDALGRPLRREVRPRDGAWRIVERFIWGEQAPDAGGYFRGRPYLQYGAAGQIKNAVYNFRGNPVQTECRFRPDLTAPVDWRPLEGFTTSDQIERAAAGLLRSDPPLTTVITYDALNRPLTRTTPDGSITAMDYGPRGLPAAIHVTVEGHTTTVLQDPQYNPAGRRTSARLGNGVRETSAYDERARFLTRRTTIASDGGLLRDLELSYDAVGNVLGITDAGQQIRYFRNAVVSPDRSLTYDALYRLRTATGREAAVPTIAPGRFDPPIHPVPDENDRTAVRRYRDLYDYDLSGNLTQQEHQAGSEGSWTTHYEIDTASDRIASLRARDGTAIPGFFLYDAAGNTTTMGGLRGMRWNEDEQLAQIDLEGGGSVYYTYDGAGQRAAKVLVHLSGTREERLYLEGYEAYRQMTGSGRVTEEAVTLHVPDGEGRLLLIERRRVNDEPDWTNWWRYQHSDQVASSTLETDQEGNVLTCEEYHPYGTTAYRAAQPILLPRRYRFGGQETDVETGLNYHGARYYAPWLCSWISPDLAGMADGTNRYTFSRNNPITYADPTGTNSYLFLGEDGLPEVRGLGSDNQVDWQTRSLGGGRFRVSIGIHSSIESPGAAAMGYESLEYTDPTVAAESIQPTRPSRRAQVHSSARATPTVSPEPTMASETPPPGSPPSSEPSPGVPGHPDVELLPGLNPADYPQLGPDLGPSYDLAAHSSGEERTFWNSGGSNIVWGTLAAVGGVVAVVAAAPLIATAAGTALAVAAVGAVAGGLGAAGGTSVAIFGAVQLATSESRTAEQNEEMNRAAELVTNTVSIGGTSAVLVAAATGANGEQTREYVERGAAVEQAINIAQGTVAIGRVGLRAARAGYGFYRGWRAQRLVSRTLTIEGHIVPRLINLERTESSSARVLTQNIRRWGRSRALAPTAEQVTNSLNQSELGQLLVEQHRRGRIELVLDYGQPPPNVSGLQLPRPPLAGTPGRERAIAYVQTALRATPEQTLEETVNILVHEGVHALGVRDSKRAEFWAFIAERVHRQENIREDDVQNLLRMIEQEYANLPDLLPEGFGISPFFPSLVF